MIRKNAVKRSNAPQLLVCVFLLASLLSGCGGGAAVAEEAAPLIGRYADDAVRYAEEAYQARQLAKYASTAGEVNRYLDEANIATRKAMEAATEAQRLVDDVPAESQLLQKVRQAQEAAERARANQAMIDRLLEVLSYGSSVDDMSEAIIQRRISIQEGPEQAQVREAVKSVLTSSICSTLVEWSNNGQFPAQQDIANDLLENAAKAAIKLSGVDEIAIDVADKVYGIATKQPEDKLAGYKKYCEIVIAQ